MKRERTANLSEIIRDEREAMSLLANDAEIGFDLETGGLSPWRHPIAVVSMYGAQSDVTAVLHIRGYLSPALRKFLARPEPLWTGHNIAGFDMLFLANNGVDISTPRYFDTLVAEQVALTTGRRDVRKTLADSVGRRLDVHLKKGQGESSWMADELTDEQWQYCANDVYYLPRLRLEQLARVEGTTAENAMAFEQALVPIIARMVLNGIPIDVTALEAWKRDMAIKALAANQLMNQHRPGLNLNSSQQVRAAIKELFDVTVFSADKSVIADLMEYEHNPDHTLQVSEFAKAFRLAKDQRKADSFYSDTWVAKHSYEGRIHPRFWQAGTDTFRFSSTDPNMQQIPHEARKVFGGVPGHTIVQADYSALEVRVAAYISKDPALVDALLASDMHTTIASGIFLKPVEEVSPKERKLAKAATFSLLFGGSAQGIVTYAKRFGSKLTIEEAEILYMGFYRQFRGLAMDRRKAENIGRMGKVVTLTLAHGGRRVLTPENGRVRPSQILNTLVQSRAAIGMKHAILECDKQGLTQYLGLTVHDELVGDVPTPEAFDFMHTLMHAMLDGMAHVTGETPMAVEGKFGSHWS